MRCGSSPPARGTLGYSTTDMSVANDRFIPACAGNTAVRRIASTLSVNGSSPPARGTQRHRRFVRLHEDSVHPRLRGEHNSSVEYRVNMLDVRFIPACAGNTQSNVLPLVDVLASVHPRLRGEHRSDDLNPSDKPMSGSSPPAREHNLMLKSAIEQL